MSQQLLWEIVKNNNAFLHKQQGVALSSDPWNNTGVQTYSSAGFISDQAVSVQATNGKDNYRNNFVVSLKQKTKFQQKTRKIRRINSIYASRQLVKSGIHTAARIVLNRFGAARKGKQYEFLRKLVNLNRANARRRVNEIKAQKAAKAQKK
ncbi:hypothetical protein pb186bvf_012000 [Paramecium bursaria]